jgi:inhibitor of cysteine peptidase
MLEMDQTQNGSVVEVSVGNILRVTLPENPTTGYRWQLGTLREPVVHVEADTFEAGQGSYGAGGARRWEFRASQVGVVHLEIELRRSWEPRPIETFRITIDVKAP